MPGERRPVVTFVTRILTHYRVPFHQHLRERLGAAGVEYRVIHGQPDAAEAAKGDLATLPWATQVTNRTPFGRAKLVWQPVWRAALASDLVVLGQENGLLVNYPLQLLPRALRPQLAFIGHGRNFQSRAPAGPAERWKRFWAARIDWWFAYTDETRRHLLALGFPDDRITVFNNAVDTTALREIAATIDEAEAARFARELGVEGSNIAVFVGGLYPDKRLGFLIAAADHVRRQIPDFALVIVGSGSDRAEVEALAASRPWVTVAGPRFGREKVLLMRAAKLFVMPGLLGLAVLDAGALGLPVMTTRYPYHSPEIAYLRDGESGAIVADWTDETAYADAVVALLADEPRRGAIAAAARRVAEEYTIEAMAERFGDGVMAALRSGRRGAR